MEKTDLTCLVPLRERSVSTLSCVSSLAPRPCLTLSDYIISWQADKKKKKKTSGGFFWTLNYNHMSVITAFGGENCSHF